MTNLIYIERAQVGVAKQWHKRNLSFFNPLGERDRTRLLYGPVDMGSMSVAEWGGRKERLIKLDQAG